MRRRRRRRRRMRAALLFKMTSLITNIYIYLNGKFACDYRTPFEKENKT